MSDEKIREILTKNEIPDKIKPENIEIMLKNSKKPKQKKISIVYKSIATLAACIIITVAVVNVMPHKEEIEIKTNKSDSEVMLGAYSNTAESYDYIYKNLRSAYVSEKFKNNIKNLFGILGSKSSDKSFSNEMAIEKSDDEAIESSADEQTTNGAPDIAEEQLDKEAGTGDAVENPEFSDTLNQVEGVNEADIIKTDGKNIYYTSGNNVYFLNVKDGEFKNVVKYPLYEDNNSNYNATYYDSYYTDSAEIFINENKLTVLYTFMNLETNKQQTGVKVFNINDDNLELVNTYIQDGYYTNSRMINNFLYLLTNDSSSYIGEITSSDDVAKFIPSYTCNDDQNFVEPDDILLPEKWNDYYYTVSYAVVSGIDINNAQEPISIKAFADFGGEIYTSLENFYFTSASYNQNIETNITKLSIKDGLIENSATGKVDGYVLNQFSMDEYNGYFRIATTVENNSFTTKPFNEESDIAVRSTSNTKNNCLYVLDENLNQVGFITDFGLDESIKSVNFSQNIAYIVTYRQTDPLYSIDLTDPTNPIIMDEVKINGYSTFMHKWTDSLLLGFGVDADENGRETGVKVVMFNTSNNNELVEEALLAYNSNGSNYLYSIATYERKALLLNSTKNIIGFPLNDYNYNYENNEQTSKSYYVFLEYNNGQFSEKGRVEFEDGNNNALRAIYIGDYLYAFSYNQAISVNINDFSQIQSINF